MGRRSRRRADAPTTAPAGELRAPSGGRGASERTSATSRGQAAPRGAAEAHAGSRGLGRPNARAGRKPRAGSGAGSGEQGGSRDRPKAPWHPFPLAEICVLAGIGLLITGFLNAEQRSGRAMLVAPQEHKWVRVSNEDLGEPGCRHYHARPRLGIVGMLLGWWRVRISSGCPLATAPPDGAALPQAR